MKIIEKILFVIAFIVAFIGISDVNLSYIKILLIAFGIIYLVSGWYLLLPIKEKTNRWLPFIISYIIAQTLFVLVFAINVWPMANLFAIFNFVILIIVFAFMYIKRESLKDNYPIKGYFIRLVVCFSFSLTPAYINLF